MENLRGLLGVRRMERFLNTGIRELCRLKKGIDERIDEGLLWCFGHVERMESDSIAKRTYVGVCAGNCSVGRPQKRWIDTVKDCLRKEVWISGKQGEGCWIGMNGAVL